MCSAQWSSAMRFARRSRCDYTVTDRKRAVAVRLQRRQRDSLPLLAPLIAETQPNIDAVMNARVSNWIVTMQRERDRRAVCWRRARRALEGYEPALRRALLTYWNSHRWLPGDPSYLLDILPVSSSPSAKSSPLSANRNLCRPVGSARTPVPAPSSSGVFTHPPE
jgi:hypothetical protein